jgi:hypothetical protein
MMAEERKSELLDSTDAIPAKLAWLSSAVSRSSAICIAIFDQDLRFRAINQVLAETHGASIEAHIGTAMDFTGDLSLQARPALQQVLRKDEELYFEAFGKFPNSAHAR